MRLSSALFTLSLSLAGVWANTEIVHFTYPVSHQQTGMLIADMQAKLRPKTLTSPHDTLDMEVIAPEQSSRTDKEKWYLLSSLEGGSSYELRLSYAATSPTEYQVSVFSLDEVVVMYNLTQAQVTPAGKVQSAAMLARVTARHAGVSVHAVPDLDLTQFNIALDKLVLGVPAQAFRLVLIILVVVLFSIFWAVPKAVSAIDAIVNNENSLDKAKSKKDF
ncbi:hypothetical protein EC988_002378 [Linderina pennispora]|nr:hypothetical protein EC988_002378 [Linderina pennispora]